MPVRYPITAKLCRMLTIAIAVPRSFPKCPFRLECPERIEGSESGDAEYEPLNDEQDTVCHLAWTKRSRRSDVRRHPPTGRSVLVAKS
jgi:hypothetical protein